MWKKKGLEVGSEARSDGTLVYTISGQLVGSVEAYAFQDEVRKKIADGAKGVVVDLGTVERIDSSGIGILVTIMWSASRAGGRLVLAALPTHVEKVLGVAMLLDHIDHAATIEEALVKVARMASDE